MPAPIEVLAFYLPQFHQIAENDEWWGAGFTEWINVASARRRFPGHNQPRTPADLGFYDLRVPETRALQAALAREYGVSGFIYWHYWFGDGRRLLERPFQEVLATGEPDFPFCLAWANQTWSGVWHGAPQRVLLEQTYPGEADYRAHFQAVLPAFRDRRYLRVNDKPLFYVLAPTKIPDLTSFIGLWRQLAAEAGLPGLYLVAAGGSMEPPDGDQFDAHVAHHGPDIHVAPRDLVRRSLRKIGVPPIYSFRRFSEEIPTVVPHHISFPCVLSGWDNSPRSGARGVVLHGPTAEAFQGQVERSVELVRKNAPGERIIFVKSWNEWAEGNYLEPDQRDGRSMLEALRSGLRGSLSAGRTG